MDLIIHENNREHLADFVRLNEQWIKHYFSIEEADRRLAQNPYGVVERGGFIFTGALGQEVVATSALFAAKPGEFELARMAVDPAFQGRGFGRLMAEHALRRAAELEAAKVFLLSNTRLKAAISLYQSIGFVPVQTGQHPVYSRCDIVMELPLSESSSI